jgi:hypothetical protein
VNYSGVAPRIPKGGKFGVGFPSAPDTVRWHIGQSGAPDQGCLWVVFCSLCLNKFEDARKEIEDDTPLGQGLSHPDLRNKAGRVSYVRQRRTSHIMTKCIEINVTNTINAIIT